MSSPPEVFIAMEEERADFRWELNAVSDIPTHGLKGGDPVLTLGLWVSRGGRLDHRGKTLWFP